MPTFEFHFDFGSPNAYLSYKVLPEIESRTGVRIDYVPVLLGGLFKATNNVSPAISLHGIKNKGAYANLETERFVKKHGITKLKFNPHFPVNTLMIMRGAIAAKREDVFENYVETCFKAMWEDEMKMDDPEVVLAVLREAGLDGAKLLDLTQDPTVKTELIENTSASVERGNFGSPSFFVGDEMFFGKNTLGDFEEEIEKQK